jgi:hypothetical protein
MLKQMFNIMGGKFCLADDSHGVEQVALNYQQCIPYLARNDISRIHFLESSHGGLDEPLDSRFPSTRLRSLTITELGALPFWRSGGASCNAWEKDGSSRIASSAVHGNVPAPSLGSFATKMP